MQISIQEAYAEACRVIGEQIVERRLIDKVQNGAEEAAIPEGE